MDVHTRRRDLHLGLARPPPYEDEPVETEVNDRTSAQRLAALARSPSPRSGYRSLRCDASDRVEDLSAVQDPDSEVRFRLCEQGLG